MKQLELVLVFLLFIFSSGISTAQQKCGFDSLRKERRIDPNFVELERLAEEKIKKAIKDRDFAKMNNTLTIPVVIHVLHLGESEGTGSNISDAQIQSSIDNLNDYYRGQIPTSPTDFEIEFALA